MNRALRTLPAAHLDTLSCFEFLSECNGMARAWHFIDCLEQSYERIMQMPYIGAQRTFKRATLRNLRQWPVKEFNDYLIFYRVTKTRIDICRILHGRRDIEAVFSKRH